MQKINLSAKLARFADHWSPKIIAELNGQHVKLVKFRGKFVWHHHEHEDELFYVVQGSFRMEYRTPVRRSKSAPGRPKDRGMRYRNRVETLHAGDLIVVPRGVEHRPVAVREVCVMLFEPASTLNTGNAGGKRTVQRPDWI